MTIWQSTGPDAVGIVLTDVSGAWTGSVSGTATETGAGLGATGLRITGTINSPTSLSFDGTSSGPGAGIGVAFTGVPSVITSSTLVITGVGTLDPLSFCDRSLQPGYGGVCALCVLSACFVCVRVYCSV